MFTNTSRKGHRKRRSLRGIRTALYRVFVLVTLVSISRCSDGNHRAPDSGGMDLSVDIRSELVEDLARLRCEMPGETPSNGLCVPKGMVGVPEGRALMGCNANVDWHCSRWQIYTYDEFPYHEVYLSSFAIDKTEVTRADYFRCVDGQACDPPSSLFGDFTTSESCVSGTSDLAPAEYPSYPVSCIRWIDAKAYCEFLGKRLCTEAEWEIAARGTDGRIWPWGNQPGEEEFSHEGSWLSPTCDYAAVTGCSDARAPVGSFPSDNSPYGALDMAGNVTEWVADWYGEYYYDSSPTTDPHGPSSGLVRVRRGGSYRSSLTQSRASARKGRDPYDRHPNTGFRCCIDILNPD